ncbi:hypothetical protein RB653_000715 [Dictyostelium firmibasis]|uniref:Integrase catalytic domain-containing protein n=1 Tax=Dictyostelium firmibasis TaxID=79012 RepID=A0AAN7U2R6_9MYCE
MIRDWDEIKKFNEEQPTEAPITYILLCIDSFTKFATGRCLTSKKTLPIYCFLAETYRGQSIKKWHCDNGKEFKNKVFDQLRDFAFPNSISTHGAPRTPQTQGVVEKLNNTIKSTIRKRRAKDNKDGINRTLSEHLHLGLNVYNNTKHRAIGMTPSQANGDSPFFSKTNIKSNCYLLGANEQKLKESTNKDLTEEDLNTIVLNNLTKYRNTWSAKPTKKEFKVGDVVLFLEVDNKKKFKRIFLLFMILFNS